MNLVTRYHCFTSQLRVCEGIDGWWQNILCKVDDERWDWYRWRGVRSIDPPTLAVKTVMDTT